MIDPMTEEDRRAILELAADVAARGPVEENSPYDHRSGWQRLLGLRRRTVEVVESGNLVRLWNLLLMHAIDTGASVVRFTQEADVCRVDFQGADEEAESISLASEVFEHLRNRTQEMQISDTEPTAGSIPIRYRQLDYSVIPHLDECNPSSCFLLDLRRTARQAVGTKPLAANG